MVRRGVTLGSLLLLARCGAPADTGAIPLDDTVAHRSLLSTLEVLVDPGGALTIHDVARAEMRPLRELRGREGDVVWLRATVEVTGDDAWYFVLAPPFNSGALHVEEAPGHFREVSIEPAGASFLAELPRTPGTHRLFLRAPFPWMLPSLLHVATLAGHQQLEQRLLTQQGLYLGVIFAMLLLNLAMGIGLRDRTHLWYVAFVSASGIYFSIQTGTVTRFVLPAVPASALFRPAMTFLAAMVLTGVVFSRRFLDTPRVAPRLDRVMRVYVGLTAGIIVIVAAAPARLVLVAMASVGAMLPFVVISAGVVAWRAGLRPARFYLLAWSLFTAGGFLFAVPFGLPAGLSISLFQGGSALEAAVLSLALVDRMRTLREERLLMASARDRAELEAARSEKLAALGQLVAGVAHEVSNPNNFLTFNLPILKDYLEAVRPHVEAAAVKDPGLRFYGLSAAEFFEDAHKLIGDMQHGTERITGIVSQLRTYARADDGREREDADVNAVVTGASTLVGSQLKKMVAQFEVHLGDGLARVRMDPGRIEQVVMNLLMNAGHAAGSSGGRVSVTTTAEDRFAVITVEDNGPGVPAELRERVFEPFFTTKQRGQGTGMGLAISKRIVDEHGGTLALSSEPGRTRFVVRLPISPGSS